jgi:hypothetical protein
MGADLGVVGNGPGVHLPDRVEKPQLLHKRAHTEYN